jgi:eukaryotic-like serine/threonine-protein kinase
MASGFREGALLGGRYRLERVLGTGGMATVWLARDERLGRPVAAKILSDTLAADPTYLRRFRREARLAAGLSHPNLVKVYDFGGDGDRPYLAMEYVKGGSLADRISAGTAPELDASRLARELLEALDHIHDAGIVHRDVKPGNVLIAPDGTAKLTDFGIAQPEDATRLTSTGLVVGTRSYIAPEVLRGERATVRSDLYSCAIILHEAVGDPPPPELAELVTRLCDEDPGRRPESASRALGLLAQPSASAGPGATTATAATEPLAPERTARTVPIGDRPRQPRGETRVLVGPRPLAGMALLAALIVLGVVLLSGGDDGSLTGGRETRDATGGESRQQAPTTSGEEPTGREEPTARSEPPKASGKPKKESLRRHRRARPRDTASADCEHGPVDRSRRPRHGRDQGC